MRASTLLIASLAAAVAVPAMAQIVPPTRKAGYWEQVMTMGGPKPMTMKSQLCTDAAMEKTINAFGQNASQSMCSKNSFRKTPTGYAFESTCKTGNSVTTSTGTATGDFAKGYTVNMVSKSTPPITPGQAESRMTIQAKWLGPCPAGRKAGDMVMPGGMVVNMANMGRPGR